MSLLLIIGCCSCKSEKEKITGVIDDEMPSDFLPFYQTFHADSIFQLSHIVFPLEGKRVDEAGLTAWNKEQWVLHKPFSAMGTFTRQLSAFNGIVIEKIIDNSGQYDMERRWSKLSDEWYLIFYKEMGQSR
jgi:hypothetical protein